VPPDKGFGPYYKDRCEEVTESPDEGCEQPSVEGPKARTLGLPTQHNDLLTQEEVLGDERGARSHEREHEVSRKLQEGGHDSSGLTMGEPGTEETPFVAGRDCCGGQAAQLVDTSTCSNGVLTMKAHTGAFDANAVARAVNSPRRSIELSRDGKATAPIAIPRGGTTMAFAALSANGDWTVSTMLEPGETCRNPPNGLTFVIYTACEGDSR